MIDQKDTTKILYVSCFSKNIVAMYKILDSKGKRDVCV